MSTAAAATAAIVYAALYAGHQIGDHIAQTDHQAATKAAPTDLELAGRSRWPLAGWRSIAGHVASYLGAQAAALMLVGTIAPLTPPGVLAGLAVSGATHAVIDRRWPVLWLLRTTGSAPYAAAPEGRYQADQALHHAALLLAALTTVWCAATGWAGGALIIGSCTVLLGAAVLAELHRADKVTGRSAAPQPRRVRQVPMWLAVAARRCYSWASFAVYLAAVIVLVAWADGVHLDWAAWTFVAAVCGWWATVYVIIRRSRNQLAGRASGQSQ
jgi:hypothetical protein